MNKKLKLFGNIVMVGVSLLALQRDLNRINKYYDNVKTGLKKGGTK